MVLLSSQINGTRPDALSHARLREFEETVRSSGLDWTILRPGGFASTAYAWIGSVRTQRAVFELTGPAAVTLREQAETLLEALGEQAGFVELPRERAREHMARFMPEPVIDGTLDILGEPLPAEQRASPDVETTLGPRAGSFAGWRSATSTFRRHVGRTTSAVLTSPAGAPAGLAGFRRSPHSPARYAICRSPGHRGRVGQSRRRAPMTAVCRV
ncbi:hypothetical protein [Streptomyces sp. NBC_00280]|uniref:hypothetical protein n=1 Tax=Streptomyces sp. NBC_00280 TaxID=2975699 RepID=UPI00352E9C86